MAVHFREDRMAKLTYGATNHIIGLLLIASIASARLSGADCVNGIEDIPVNNPYKIMCTTFIIMCIAATVAGVITILENREQSVDTDGVTNRERSVDVDVDVDTVTMLKKTAATISFCCAAAVFVSAGYVIESRVIHNACIQMT